MLIAVLLGSFSTYAYDFEADGMYYTVISVQDLTCKVSEGDIKYEGDIVIPSEVTYNNRNLSVVAIGEEAFSKCSSLTSVTIPNSVTSIGKKAFADCSSLTSVTIPNSVTKIGQRAFYGCSSLTEVTIPNSVTIIELCAFYECSSLTSVTIPNSVTSIGNYAFKGCSSLTEVTIPDSVTEIGESAFYGCSSLTEVTIPNSVTEIGSDAFYRCSALTSMKIPDSVTQIGRNAFYGCSSLTSVTIPNSVTKIGDFAFIECSSLTSVKIPDSVTQIGDGAFADCSSMTLVTIGNSVKKIGSDVFSGCSSLTSVTIGKSLTKLGDIFDDCDSLTKFSLLHSDYNITLEGDWLNNIKELYIDRPLQESIKFSNLEKLELGESITRVQVKDMDGLDKLTTIESHALVPPTLPRLSNLQYMNINVFVPEEALEAYKADENWGKFWNLQASGIEDVKADSIREVIGLYDMNGRAVSEDYKGMVIVRFSDGTCKKIIQK